MISLPIALHTAARRWLMQQYARWTEKYDEIGGGRSGAYTKRDLDTFPRYLVASAMLEGVERLRPKEFSSLAEAREKVIEAGVQAQTVFTDPPGGEIETRAMAEERAAFEQYVRTISEAEISRIEALPYRRVLSEQETERGRRIIRDVWGVESYWYPIGETSRSDVIAFHYVADAISGAELRRILQARGVGRVHELREFGPSYELALELLEPEYNGAEGFWFAPASEDSAGEWLVYASHEGTLTIGGTWLIEQVKKAWTEWERHIWDAPFR